MDEHWKKIYSDNVKDLVGGQKRSLLKELVDKDAKKGEAVFFDMDQEDDDATFTAGATAEAANNRRNATDPNSLTLAEINAISTPHMQVLKDRTMCENYLNEWGHDFASEDQVYENANRDSRVVNKGMKKIFKNQDLWIFDALFRQTEKRGKSGGTSTAFPAAQKLPVLNGLGLSTLTRVVEIFENNYADDEPVVLIISPTQKKYLIDNSGGTIHSRDFVDSADFFKTGKLPEIYGCNLVCHPGVTAYKAVPTGTAITDTVDQPTDSFAAFQKSAIMYNQFKDLMVQMGTVPERRHKINLYIHELVGSCRLDDYRVIQGVIGTHS